MLNIGKVIKFDGYTGEIVDSKNKYIFLDKDMEMPINIGDIVSFHGEKIHDVYRAFIVKKYVNNEEKIINKNRKISDKNN